MAAAGIFGILDLEPPIDYKSTSGEKPVTVKGEVNVNKAEFSYPTRLDTKVLKGSPWSLL